MERWEEGGRNYVSQRHWNKLHCKCTSVGGFPGETGGFQLVIMLCDCTESLSFLFEKFLEEALEAYWKVIVNSFQVGAVNTWERIKTL